jgi:3'-phosphoadenosine 5'-phosphosulfate sulfotransferase (PAPS reductase)/FAD synthetase
MKKKPAKDFEKETDKKPIVGSMADESLTREADWIKNGCNAFNSKRPTSNPMSFWTEQDILRYIKEKKLPICSVYGRVVIDYEDEEQFNGQMDFSDLGLIEDTRKLKTTGCSRTGCMFCGYGCHLEEESRFERMKITHPKIYDYIMRPKEQGELNYKEVIDWINANSDLNIRY